ncbi:hypothetical protein FXO38_36315 [Capsicum annuum]|nr:hypothetical protein FXO38_36315 [Capsicum annuum]KAF3616914.1 hypothetical protein FXO37_34871 [Capsicum annuum]
MPKYAKYLKDVVKNKTNMGEIDTIALTGEYSSMLMSNMPKKLKDPGSFTLPIQIGESNMFHELSDIGGSINIMPLYDFNTLGWGKLGSFQLCSIWQTEQEWCPIKS